MNEWIKCEDRLPSTEEYVVVQYSIFDLFRNAFDKGWLRAYYSLEFKRWELTTTVPVKITHWMKIELPDD